MSAQLQNGPSGFSSGIDPLLPKKSGGVRQAVWEIDEMRRMNSLPWPVFIL
jgi:hypothetical protein